MIAARKRTNEQLAALAGKGDRQAQGELVTRNRGLIYKVARKYARDADELDDLFQIGSMAMLESARRFNIRRGIRFSTFVHLALSWNIRRARKKARSRDMVSLDNPLGENGESTYHELIEDGSLPSVGAELQLAEEVEQMRAALAKLPERERQIVLARANGQTLKQVGGTVGVCRERIRQIERDLLRLLRELMEPGARVAVAEKVTPTKNMARWTAAERAFMRKNYAVLRVAGCAVHLHRTKEAVAEMARRLGLHCPKGRARRVRIVMERTEA